MRPRRPVVPCIAALAGPVAWTSLKEPGHLAGLVTAEVALFTVVPLALMTLVLSGPALLSLLVPRDWRIAYRQRRPREEQRSSYIPARLRRIVMRVDRGRCIYCGSTDKPQVDHFRPWAAGGITALWNMFVLCAFHNRVKSNYWRDRDGYVHYRGWNGAQNMDLAADILAVERRHRRSLLRWLRMSWAWM